MMGPFPVVRFFASAVLVGAIALGLRSMAPTITAGDSAELSCAQATLGIAHSPGYPLFALAGRAFTALLPFGHPAYRTNLFSLFCGGLAAMVLFLFFDRLLVRDGGLDPGRALWAALSVLCFWLVPAVRGQFLSTEVFALNALWAALIIGTFWLSQSSEDVRPIYVGAYLIGLGIGNQHTIIAFMPALVLLLAARTAARGFRPAHWIGALLFAVLGASIYLYLPIRSMRQPLLDWEDPETLRRFQDVLTRARYGTFQIAQGVSASLDSTSLKEGSVFFARLAAQHLGPILSLTLLGGAFLCSRDRSLRSFSAALGLSLLLAGPLFFSLTRGWTQANPEVVARFLPLPLIIFFAWGMSGILRMRKIFPAAVLILAAFCVLFLKRESLARQWLVRDLGRSIFQTLPPRATLILDRADEAEFSVAYLQMAEGMRRDARIIDANAGVTRSIYGDDYYAIWGKPRLARRERVETGLIRTAVDPVYYATVEPAMIPSIAKRPSGLLHAARPLDIAWSDWDDFYAFRADLSEPGFRGAGLLSAHFELLGKYYLAAGRDAEAMLYLELWALSVPGRSFHHHAALAAMESGRLALAETLFARAYARESEKYKILGNWGLLLERLGRDAEAERKYREAVQARPESPEAYYKLGALYWRQQKWKMVVDAFERLLMRDPNHPDARRFLEAARKRI